MCVTKICYIVVWDDYDWKQFATVHDAQQEIKRLQKENVTGQLHIIKQTREWVETHQKIGGPDGTDSKET